MNTIDAIKNRKTIKVLASQPKLVTMADDALIDTLIESAYWAPFHKPCDVSFRKDSHQLSAIMPWRFYVLDASNCRKLAEYLTDKDICMGKIEPMLHLIKDKKYISPLDFL